MIVACECGAKLKVDESRIGPQGVKVRCPRCGNVTPVRPSAAVPRTAPAPAPKTAPDRKPVPSTSGPVVLVAHDSEVVRDTVCSVLSEAGFGYDIAIDGVEALKKATQNRPAALVLDVGLPGIYGFELCERLKGSQETAGIKIILLSSVYDMRRYKRTPVNLYGADDYIEKHHIPDFLPTKLKKLLMPDTAAEAEQAKTSAVPKSELPEMARPPAREFQPSMLAEATPRPVSSVRAGQTPPADAGDPAPVLPESFSLDASIFQKEECDIPKVEAADPGAIEKARRFARIIVSDIALYNQEAVIQGLKDDTFYDLLKNDIEEGRDIFNKRVPEMIRAQKDYYQEAFDNFIRAAKKNVR